MIKLCPQQMTGSVWDESGNSEIRQILISHGRDTINSIQFEYDLREYGSRFSGIHGQPNGSNFKSVVFDYPSEFLTSVSGGYDGDDKLISITFGTNKREYGPFGADVVQVKEQFNYDFGPRNKIGGFHGTVFDSCVYAIGIYIKPVAVEPLDDDDPAHTLLAIIDERF